MDKRASKKAGMKKELATYAKYKYLLIELIRKNIKLKYRNSWLGMVWTFLQPLLNMAVLAMVFTNIFGKSEDNVVCYPIYLLTGRLVFEFFTQSTKKALRSFRENASIVKKVYVPKYMYPVSGVLSNFVTSSISFAVLLAVTLLFKLTGWSNGSAIALGWHLILIIVPLVILLIFSVGVGLILSTLAVYFRDIEYIYDVFCTLLFYMMPVVYNVGRIENRIVNLIIRIDPLYSITEMVRQCVLYGELVSWQAILYSLCWALLTLGLGVFIFYRKSDDFILHI